MPDIFDINFSNLAGDTLPPDKRDVNTLALVRGLESAVNTKSNESLKQFKTGAGVVFGPWAAGTYIKNEYVLYKYKLYVALATTTQEPTTGAEWLEVLPSFLGTDKEQFFDGTKLMFEYALNAYFAQTNGAVWRQPTAHVAAPDFYTPKSDIYLTTNEIINPVFRVGLELDDSSTVGVDYSSEAVGNDYSFALQYALTINVLTSVFNTMGTTTAEKEATIRNFADRYITAGLFYDIIPY